MTRRLFLPIVAAIGCCTLFGYQARAQYTISPSVNSPSIGIVQRPYFGGTYSFGDPAFMVTPFGLQAVDLGSFGMSSTGFRQFGYDSFAMSPFEDATYGTRNNGSSGSGFPATPTWEMLQETYAQGYRDAVNTTRQAADRNANDAGAIPSPRRYLGPPVPHGADSVRASRLSNGQLTLRWVGDPRVASSISFALTDRSNRTLARTTISRLPAVVHFTPSPGAAFYEVVVHYIDGGTNTIMSRL